MWSQTQPTSHDVHPEAGSQQMSARSRSSGWDWCGRRKIKAGFDGISRKDGKVGQPSWSEKYPRKHSGAMPEAERLRSSGKVTQSARPQGWDETIEQEGAAERRWLGQPSDFLRRARKPYSDRGREKRLCWEAFNGGESLRWSVTCRRNIFQKFPIKEISQMRKRKREKR